MMFQRTKAFHIVCKHCAARGVNISYSFSDLFVGFRCASSSAASASHSNHFIVEYLVKSSGFSLKNAAKVSRELSHLKSTTKPESVLNYLRQSGFSNIDIEKIASSFPKLLCASVEKTLKPRLHMLHDLGLSQSQVSQLVVSCPNILRSGHQSNIQQKIAYYTSLYGSQEKLIKTLKNDNLLISSSLDKRIMPNISLLRACGIPNDQIVKLMSNCQRLITRSPEHLKTILQRADELGISRTSPVFWRAVNSMNCNNSTGIDAKLRLLKVLGWTDSEVATMVRKSPFVLDCSAKKLSAVTDFLKNEVGCELSYIVTRPSLLMHSMGSRMIPRYRVMQLLKSKDLSEGKRDFYSSIVLSEEKFLKKFVIPFKEIIPGVEEAYAASFHAKTTA